MNISKEKVSQYLRDVKNAVRLGKYRISSREKNELIYLEYVFSEAMFRDIIMDLEVEDFSKAVYNTHPDYSNEILYIFGKEVK